jgi:hypothetical protein
MNPDTLGDAPIEEKHREQMHDLAEFLDQLLNPDLENKTTGFVLMMFPMSGHKGRCNYISNGRREDVVRLLRDQLARFEGDVAGHA